MGMRAEKLGALPGKIRKKSTENKKNEANAWKEPGDCKDASPIGVDGSFKLSKEEKKKKDKKNNEVCSNVQLDRIHDAVNREDCAEVDNAGRKEKDQKKKPNRYIIQRGMRVEKEPALPEKIENNSEKNKKNDANASEEAGGCGDEVPNKLEDCFRLSKEDEKKKMDKKKHEVCSNVQHDGNFDEAVHAKDCAEVDNAHRKEKDQKKKKKKKIEAAEDRDASDNVTKMEGEEERIVQINGGKDSGQEVLLYGRNHEHRVHMENTINDGSDTVLPSVELLEESSMKKDDSVKGQNSSEKEDATEMKSGEWRAKKRKNRKSDEEDIDLEGHKQITDLKEVGKLREGYDGDMMDKVKKKMRIREKKQDVDHMGSGLQEIATMGQGDERTMVEDKGFGHNEGNAYSTRNKTLDRKKKNGNKGKRKKPDSAEINSEDRKSEGKSKKVRFSDHVLVFPSSDDDPKEKIQEEDLVRGKRFSKEEDEIIKEAVYNYIKVNCLGEEGLEMVLHCRSYPKVKNCWKEIGAVLPHRPHQSIYYRAHILFERGERTWTPEEYELLRKFHEKEGPDWKQLAAELGKHRFHVKDAWRRIKLPNMKKGNWSQEEYQNLFDLVNMDLRMKAFEEKKSKHGMLRDNICWGAISDKLSTRSDAICCMKWYRQLTSPMVAEGEWADADDYRLLTALFSLDACCVEDVDWDNLIDYRSGDVCRKRWNQMALHLGQHGSKSFAEQVEILSKRYCPDLLEAREIWDSKPIVP